MKLFQRLLVAPAALGLLAPIAANATEVNLNDISNYTDEGLEISSDSFGNYSTENPLLIAGGEGLHDDHGSDGFSSTTSASFSTDMVIGAVDGNSTSEAVVAGYSFQIDLNTSFTGDDSLDVSIDAGNAGGALSELDLNSSGDSLAVDGVSYTFPLGDSITAFVGDNTDGSLLFSTACVYGGVTNVLDDCGNGNAAIAASLGTAAGASIDMGDGWSAGIGYEGTQGTDGLMTKEGLDAYAAQIAYNSDSYGASITYAMIETSTTAETTYWAFNGYWAPSDTGSVPSISVGYEVGDPSSGSDTEQLFVGLQWDEVGAGTLGAALGTVGGIADGATEYYQYEAFYSYPINDGMTITPIVYLKETSGNDETGVLVKTSFSF